MFGNFYEKYQNLWKTVMIHLYHNSYNMSVLRQKMTSGHLQEKFRKQYEEFFLRNDLVLSGCFSMWWGSVIHGFTGDYPIAKTKTFLRGFVWINILQKEVKSKITTVTEYDIIHDLFESVQMHEINAQISLLENIIDEFLRKHEVTQSVSIEILTEIPRGHCFGFSGLVWGLIAEGIFRIFDQLNTNDTDVLKASLAKELELVSKHQNSIWENSIHVLTDYSWIALCTSENEDYKLSQIENSDLDNIPLDFWIIFSGTKADTTYLEKSKKNKAIIFDELTQASNNLGYKLTNLSASYQDIYTALSSKSIDLLTKMALTGNASITTEFINNINALASHIDAIYGSQPLTESMRYLFSKNVSNKWERLWFVPLYTSSHGGSYAFFMERWISQNTFLKAVEELQQSFPDIRIEYASFLDKSKDSRKLTLEQFRSDGILHPIFSNKLFRVDYFNSERTYCDNFLDIDNALLFDIRTGKIFFKGRSLDSKCIPSQKTTTEIFVELIKTSNFKISNTQLPQSSYRNSKSEMTSKVVSPLLRFLKSENEELILSCKWSISAFDFEFVHASLPIGVVYSV